MKMNSSATALTRCKRTLLKSTTILQEPLHAPFHVTVYMFIEALQVCVNTLTAALLVRPLKCPTHVRHLRKQRIFSSRHLATNQHVRVCILVATVLQALAAELAWTQAA